MSFRISGFVSLGFSASFRWRLAFESHCTCVRVRLRLASELHSALLPSQTVPRIRVTPHITTASQCSLHPSQRNRSQISTNFTAFELLIPCASESCLVHPSSKAEVRRSFITTTVLEQHPSSKVGRKLITLCSVWPASNHSPCSPVVSTWT